MGTPENELKRDAQEQRERMGDTLEAIGDRLSPERMVERRKAAVGQRFRSVKESVMGSPSYAEPRNGGLRDRADSIAGSASDAVGAASQRVQQTPQAIADQARGNPIAAGLVAFGIGALVATALPKSRTEQRLVDDARPQLQHAADELKEVGRQVGSDAKDRAGAAVEEVKATGADAKDNVRDQARESVEQVKSNTPSA